MFSYKYISIYKYFILISLVLLAMPIQVREKAISSHGLGRAKAITNSELNANEGSNSTFVRVVLERTRPSLHLVGLASIANNVLVVPCKVKIAKCIKTVS